MKGATQDINCSPRVIFLSCRTQSKDMGVGHDASAG